VKPEKTCIMCSLPKRAVYAVRDINAPDGSFYVCEAHAQWWDDEASATGLLQPGWIRRIQGAT
jgi:hypothetical protein